MTLGEDQKLKTNSSVAGVVEKANSVMDVIPKVGNKTGSLFISVICVTLLHKSRMQPGQD